METIVIFDASTLINFIESNLIDRLAQLSLRLEVPEQVLNEVVNQNQKGLLNKAIQQGHLHIISVDDDIEEALFIEMSKSRRLGQGESAAIAIACSRGHILATDDRRAIRQIPASFPEKSIWKTEDILKRMISANVLEYSEIEALPIDASTKARLRLLQLKETALDAKALPQIASSNSL